MIPVAVGDEVQRWRDGLRGVVLVVKGDRVRVRWFTGLARPTWVRAASVGMVVAADGEAVPLERWERGR